MFEEGYEILAGYGPLGLWLLWQLYKEKKQDKTIADLTESLTETSNNQGRIAEAIADLRTYLIGRGK